MRSELEQLEQIDQYLSGKMSPDQAASFEAQMNADPALKSMVQDQQLLIQTVSRTAMMAEIKAVAGIAAGAAAGGGAASAGWGLTQWILVGVTAVGATVGGVAIYNSVNEDETEVVEETVNPQENNNETLIAKETFDTSEMYTFEMTVDEDDTDESVVEDRGSEDVNYNNRNNNYELSNQPEDADNDPLIEFSNLDGNQTTDDNEHIAETEELDTEEVVIIKNRKAQFTGGHPSLQAHFAKNLTYPGTAMKEKVQGTVVVTIMIGRDGKIEVIGSEMKSLFDENGKLLTGFQRGRHRKAIKKFKGNAERAFRISPNWVPATNTSGSPRQSTQTWYVKFNLQGKSEVYSFGEDSGSLEPESNSDGIHEYSDEDVFFEVQANQYDLSEPTNK